ncbi:hypothetical protein AA313_de0201299 [Arthrobotrys entomopaga]|nr:hypothetical protein AA313_de0201299 [Arthrobotrys entomopaga]
MVPQSLEVKLFITILNKLQGAPFYSKLKTLCWTVQYGPSEQSMYRYTRLGRRDYEQRFTINYGDLQPVNKTFLGAPIAWDDWDPVRKHLPIVPPALADLRFSITDFNFTEYHDSHPEIEPPVYAAFLELVSPTLQNLTIATRDLEYPEMIEITTEHPRPVRNPGYTGYTSITKLCLLVQWFMPGDLCGITQRFPNVVELTVKGLMEGEDSHTANWITEWPVIYQDIAKLTKLQTARLPWPFIRREGYTGDHPLDRDQGNWATVENLDDSIHAWANLGLKHLETIEFKMADIVDYLVKEPSRVLKIGNMVRCKVTYEYGGIFTAWTDIETPPLPDKGVFDLPALLYEDTTLYDQGWGQ